MGQCLPPPLGSEPFVVITQGLVKPLGAPLALQNHSVTDQGREAIVWGGWGEGSGWASQSFFLSSFANVGF